MRGKLSAFEHFSGTMGNTDKQHKQTSIENRIEWTMLSESNIAECQSKFNLSYHVPFARICQDLVGFQGKDVLEVGGSLPPEFVFDYLHVKSWSGIETPDYEESLKQAGGLSHTGTILYDLQDVPKLGFKDRSIEKYNFFLANIEDLPPEYYETYDLIFSIATFEHIHKLPAALDKMFLALKPGGKLFSLFAPIWSSCDGHHLPKITDRSGQVFDFANSPIPPWGHLLIRPPELCDYLYQYTDKETADLIVYYVYNSPHINRYFTEDYLSFIEASLFEIVQINLMFEVSVDESIQTRLERLCPGRRLFKNNGLLTLLERTEGMRSELVSIGDKFLRDLNLKDINLIVFPNWSESAETFGLELQEVMAKLVRHSKKGYIKILVYNSQIPAEDADFILSSIIMNLLMEESVEVDRGPDITLLQDLNQRQWSALIPNLQFRVKLKCESKQAILVSKVETILTIELEQIDTHIPSK